jgi:hypothetical protein
MLLNKDLSIVDVDYLRFFNADLIFVGTSIAYNLM